MPNEKDYPYIRAWGSYMGSLRSYIQEQVVEARAANAPDNAIYERDGVWRTTDTITNPDAREALKLPPLQGLEPIVLERAHATRNESELTFATAAYAVRWADSYARNFARVDIVIERRRQPYGAPLTLLVTQ